MTGRRKYLVTWEMHVDADSPVEAARAAREFQTKPDTTATVFDVIEHDSQGDPVRVDLTALDDDDDGDLCRDCAIPYEDGGDGYNGRCPDCADIAEAEGRADD